ncbi:MAG: hypothetical protein E6778_18140 [Niallia nealsonii]|nr:hypothetical protein [Niallia nealsonii]
MEYYKYLRQYVGHRPIILPGSNVIILNHQMKCYYKKDTMDTGDYQVV